jgi:hypothetical protein
VSTPQQLVDASHFRAILQEAFIATFLNMHGEDNVGTKRMGGRSKCHNRTGAAWAILILVPTARLAPGAFVNGIESFDGTTLDTATWEIYSSQITKPVTQNNALTISTANTVIFSDYTTRSQTVKVGERVSVEVTINAYSTVGGGGRYAALYLTTNSAGTTHNSQFDDYKIWIWNDKDFNKMYWIYGDTALNVAPLTGPMAAPQPEGTTFRYEIDRISSSEVAYFVYDNQGNKVINEPSIFTLGNSIHAVAPHPAPLFISLYADGASVTFDNVTISAIPEPTSALLAGVPSVLLLLRRKVGR